MTLQPHFTQEDHKTWSLLYSGLEHSRSHQAHPLFTQGTRDLDFQANRIPDLEDVNRRLRLRTGWQGMWAEGLVENPDFFAMLAERIFPIGNFIRSPEDLAYTPAPDVFHDLYGHLPLLADRNYAEFSQRIGLLALPYLKVPEILEQFGRYFWFAAEFCLVEHLGERRIFGGGILSSQSECNYSLSMDLEVKDGDVEEIRRRPYHIDDFQQSIYVWPSPESLYSSLEAFAAGVKKLLPGEELPIIRRQIRKGQSDETQTHTSRSLSL